MKNEIESKNKFQKVIDKISKDKKVRSFVSAKIHSIIVMSVIAFCFIQMHLFNNIAEKDTVSVIIDSVFILFCIINIVKSIDTINNIDYTKK